MKRILTPDETELYSRQISLAEIGPAGQTRLLDARVLVVGAGGLGSPLLTYLSSCGVGNLGIIDGDTVAVSNLHRQVLFGAADVGRSKAETAAERLGVLNRSGKVDAYPFAMSAQNARDIISKYDLVADGSDNFATRYLINDACVELGKPFVSASLQGFLGQLSVFNFGGGPTYRCLYPEPPAPEDAPACGDNGVLGSVPGLVGLLQANECLKLILGIGELLSGKLLLVDTLRLKFEIVEFGRNDAIAGATRVQDTYRFERQCLNAPACNDQEVFPDEFQNILEKDKSLYLLDVREQRERDEYHIGGEHIPMALLPAKLDRLPHDRTVVIYCRSGVRSLLACRQIRSKLGLERVYSLGGGLEAYKDYIARSPS